MQTKGILKDFFLTANNTIVMNLEANVGNLSNDELIALKSAKNGIKIDLCEWKEKRSLNANSYFHLLVHRIAEKLKIGNDECKIKMNLEYGTPATDNTGNKVIVKLPSSVNVCDFYEYSKWIAEKEENGLKLSYYLFYKQTHTLDIKEMARLIDGVIQEAQQLGIETITPLQKAEMLSLWESYRG